MFWGIVRFKNVDEYSTCSVEFYSNCMLFCLVQFQMCRECEHSRALGGGIRTATPYFACAGGRRVSGWPIGGRLVV